MNLAGQAKKPPRVRDCTNQHGYAMAALIVAMAIMAVMMSVAMPVWKQTTQREKEEELVFRGKQYVHAIGLYQRKFANAYPPNVDLLVEQKFLRKKYKDPITNDDFVVLPPGTALPGAPVAPGQRGAPGAGTGPTTSTRGGVGTGRSSGSPLTTAPQPSQPSSRGGLAPIGSQPGGIGGGTSAGVAGVTSKSKEQSLRLYNGRNHYNEWAFVYTPQLQPGQTSTTPPGVLRGNPQPGVGPGGRGQQGTDPFGRGRGTEPGQRGPSPFGPGQSPFGPTNPPGGRGFGPGTAQPIFPPNPRGR
ncbi:MAG TPA: type II secretion system protein [Vicinamibacterales bacterium]|nr:type II secretion system protein [Vicinamibacterales bacterium]